MKPRQRFDKRKFPWKGPSTRLDSSRGDGRHPVENRYFKACFEVGWIRDGATSWPFNPIRRKGTRVAAFHRAFWIRAYVSASIRVHAETHVRLTGGFMSRLGTVHHRGNFDNATLEQPSL